MNKKTYTPPCMEKSWVDLECHMLRVSTNNLPGSDTDEEDDGSGKDADANERDPWKYGFGE